MAGRGEEASDEALLEMCAEMLNRVQGLIQSLLENRENSPTTASTRPNCAVSEQQRLFGRSKGSTASRLTGTVSNPTNESVGATCTSFTTIGRTRDNIASSGVQPSPEHLEAQMRALSFNQEAMHKEMIRNDKEIMDELKATRALNKQLEDQLNQINQARLMGETQYLPQTMSQTFTAASTAPCLPCPGYFSSPQTHASVYPSNTTTQPNLATSLVSTPQGLFGVQVVSGSPSLTTSAMSAVPPNVVPGQSVVGKPNVPTVTVPAPEHTVKSQTGLAVPTAGVNLSTNARQVGAQKPDHQASPTPILPEGVSLLFAGRATITGNSNKPYLCDLKMFHIVRGTRPIIAVQAVTETKEVVMSHEFSGVVQVKPQMFTPDTFVWTKTGSVDRFVLKFSDSNETAGFQLAVEKVKALLQSIASAPKSNQPTSQQPGSSASGMLSQLAAKHKEDTSKLADPSKGDTNKSVFGEITFKTTPVISSPSAQTIKEQLKDVPAAKAQTNAPKTTVKPFEGFSFTLNTQSPSSTQGIGAKSTSGPTPFSCLLSGTGESPVMSKSAGSDGKAVQKSPGRQEEDVVGTTKAFAFGGPMCRSGFSFGTGKTTQTSSGSTFTFGSTAKSDISSGFLFSTNNTSTSSGNKPGGFFFGTAATSKNSEETDLKLSSQSKTLKDLLQSEPAASSSSLEKSIVETDKEKQSRPMSELFKPAEGSWKCSGCLLQRGGSVQKCPACGALKQGVKPEDVKNVVGASTDSSGTGASNRNGFKFGSGFSFGGVTSGQQGGGFISGSPAPKKDIASKPTETTSGFSFSANHESAKPPKKEESP